MADTTLQLAVIGGETFTFSGAEIPEKIPFGGQQKLAKHELVGGRRVVDAMGKSDMSLAWSGFLLGQAAFARARFLDYLRASGKQATLSWGGLSYLVVMEDFTADYERFYKMPYRISFVVVQDLANPVTAVADASVDEAMRADNNAAKGLGGVIGDANLSAILTTLDGAISAVSSFATATTAAINSVMNPINAIQSRLNTLMSASGNAMQNLSTFGGNLGPNGSNTFASSFLNSTAAANQLPAILNLNALMARMKKNLKK